MNTHDKFEAVNDDYLEFDKVENKLSKRSDLHAFLLLDKIFGDHTRDIISAACHDEIWLAISPEEIESLNDGQILELVRCGVSYDDNNESLHLFV